jgi:hypothetical protein
MQPINRKLNTKHEENNNTHEKRDGRAKLV